MQEDIKWPIIWESGKKEEGAEEGVGVCGGEEPPLESPKEGLTDRRQLGKKVLSTETEGGTREVSGF